MGYQNQPAIYDLINGDAGMDGYNTSAGDGSGPAGNLHWMPGTQQAQMDPRGIPTMPNVDPRLLLSRQTDMGGDYSRPAPSEIPPAPNDMQAYSDRLLHSPDLGRPSDYVQGTPDGGMRQSMGQQIAAPFRDALSSLMHPGAASDPRLAPDPMGATPGTLQGQQSQAAPAATLQDLMRGRYQHYADLTDANMQTLQDQQRGLRRRDTIDGFLGRVVAPIAGGMMARHGNPYAMAAMNKFSSDAASNADMHRAEQYQLMDATNKYGKQAFDQMVATDPQTIKNQLALMKAQTDALRGGAYVKDVDNRGVTSFMNAGANQQNANTKQQSVFNEMQKAQDARDQFEQKMQNEMTRTAELLRNGTINRQLAQARIENLKNQAGQFQQMMGLHEKQLQAQLYGVDANNMGALDRLLRGEKFKQGAATSAQDAAFKAMANKRIIDKQTGQMVPVMSPGFVADYGTPDPVEPEAPGGGNDLMAGFRSFFLGQPATAAPQANVDTSAQQYIPNKNDLPAMQAALRAKMQGAQ